jgi:hypothetical protein
MKHKSGNKHNLAEDWRAWSNQKDQINQNYVETRAKSNESTNKIVQQWKGNMSIISEIREI